MELFAALAVFWVAVIVGGKFLWRGARTWRRARGLVEARTLAEIRDVAYYRRISSEQFGKLVFSGLEARRFVALGDPWLGDARRQGFLWRNGVKTVLVAAMDEPLTSRRLLAIAQRMKKAGANRVLVFSPFADAPEPPAGLELLYGNALCSWFSVLKMAPPRIAGHARDLCSCGSPAVEGVSRAGLPVLCCHKLPECGKVRPLVLPHLPSSAGLAAGDLVPLMR